MEGEVEAKVRALGWFQAIQSTSFLGRLPGVPQSTVVRMTQFVPQGAYPDLYRTRHTALAAGR